MESEDALCIARIAHGDEAALNALYERYRPQLYRFLWPQLQGDEGRVEDVMQDTFLTVWRKAATFRGEARVATWVWRIALHCASHTQRGPARQAAQTLSLSDLHDEAEWSSSSDHEDRTLTRLALHDALARLSEKHRVVVLLVFGQGFTSEEAAAILGLPVGTIKSRLRAARALLVNDPALQQSEEVSS